MLRSGLIALSRSRWLGRFISKNPVAWRGASRFIAGETIDEAVAAVRELNASGMDATLDFLGENVNSRAAAQATSEAYTEALDAIRANDLRSGISLKLTALGLDLSEDVATQLLRGVLEHAAAGESLPVTIDMEGSAYTDATLRIFRAVRADHPHVGTVIQSYLHRSAADVQALARMGARVRLVKGAYLEPPEIAFQEREEVDAELVRLIGMMLAAPARAAGAFAEVGSHDETIIEWTREHALQHSIPSEAFEFQMLYGIRRDLQRALVEDGYRVRTYVPYGTEWYPYFMRRLAERPENVGFVIRSVLSEGRG